MGMSVVHCQGNVREFHSVWRVVTLYVLCHFVYLFKHTFYGIKLAYHGISGLIHSVSTGKLFAYMYTVGHKKRATFIFSITLANIDGFS